MRKLILRKIKKTFAYLKVPQLPARNNKRMMHLAISGKPTRKARKKRCGIKCKKIGICDCMVLIRKMNLQIFLNQKKSFLMQVADLDTKLLGLQLWLRNLGFGIDYSDAVRIAVGIAIIQFHSLLKEILQDSISDGSIDYVSCDQVIMHTQNPDETCRTCSHYEQIAESCLLLLC